MRRRTPAIEFVKKDGKDFFWYSRTIVRYADGNVICVHIREKCNVPAVWHVLDRISDQIGDHTSEVFRVGAHRGDIAKRFNFQFVLSPCRRPRFPI